MDIQLKTVTISQLPVLDAASITPNTIVPVVDTLNVNRTVTMRDLSLYTQTVGEVLEFVKDANLPSNYVPLTGGVLSRSVYPALCSHLKNGVLYGTGLFNDTFVLPNLTHSNANLRYAIFAGIPLPAQPIAISSASLFSTQATVNGGSLIVLTPTLSAFLTIPANQFYVNTSISIILPSSASAGFFGGNNTVNTATQFFSNTGLKILGAATKHIANISGRTTFEGINTLSALSLVSYPTHPPFVIRNNATSTLLFNETNTSTVNNFVITIPVNDFEKTVSGNKFKLKSFIARELVNPNTVFVEISSAQPVTSPSLSALLLDGIRDKNFSLVTVFSGVAVDGTPGTPIEMSLPFEFPLFFRTPVKYNNKWGYILDGNDELDQFLLEVFRRSGNTWSPSLTALDEFLGFLTLSATPAWRNAAQNVKFVPRPISLLNCSAITSLTAIDNTGQKLLKINVPITSSNFINTVITYYTR